ncbi:MAG: translation initiation factor IF-3 [candidate division WOR-3 bacterium]|nr:translation initiation factor IF-3 [candidate division WOR-3 bacterium]
MFNLIRRLIISNKRTRVNRHIHASEVRLVDENDEQIGIVSIEEALEQAKMAGLDLVEVAPNARPPVVRIMDYGKYKYEMQKREKKAKKKQHSQQLKELQVRPRIFEHDLDIKINKARKFFEKKYKVKFVIKYRGRELKHYDDGKDLLAYIRESISDVAKPDHEPKFESRRITQIFSPAGNN